MYDDGGFKDKDWESLQNIYASQKVTYAKFNCACLRRRGQTIDMILLTRRLHSLTSLIYLVITVLVPKPPLKDT